MRVSCVTTKPPRSVIDIVVLEDLQSFRVSLHYFKHFSVIVLINSTVHLVFVKNKETGVFEVVRNYIP